MVKFANNQIMSEKDQISQALISARLEKNFALKDVSASTGISLKYLEAIEKGKWSRLPDGVYRKNFLREYALFLKLDADSLVRAFQEGDKEAASQKSFFSKQIVAGKYFWAMPRLVKNGILISIAVICFGYLAYCLKETVTPPTLVLNSPRENMVTDKRTVDIIGSTENEAQIFVNGESVLSDSHGFFNKKVNLKNGINTVTVSARKKYGQENVIVRQILVKG